MYDNSSGRLSIIQQIFKKSLKNDLCKFFNVFLRKLVEFYIISNIVSQELGEPFLLFLFQNITN